MPRQTQDQRREEQHRKGRAWAQWLASAMAELPIDVKTLVERAQQAGATFDKTNVSRWLSGTKNAEPHHAVIVARILHRNPADALRAAGHQALADAMADPAEAEQRARIAQLDAEIDARLARLEEIRAISEGEKRSEEDGGGHGAS